MLTLDRFIVRLFGMLALFVLATNLHAEPVMYKWDSVPGAAYYQGRVQDGKGDASIRTREIWLLYEPYTDIELYAIDEWARRIERVKIRGEYYVDYSEKEETKLQAVAERPVSVPETPREEIPDDFVNTVPYRFLSVDLQIGQETIHATGGVSTFDGSSFVGGTKLSLLMDWTLEGSGRYAAVIEGRGHNLTTEQKRQVEVADQQETVTTSRLFRSSFGGAAYYAFGPKERKFFAGLGIKVDRVPRLRIVDAGSAITELAEASLIMPILAALYRHQVGSGAIWAVADVAPVVLGDVKSGFGLDLSAVWRRALLATIYWEAGVVTAYRSYVSELDGVESSAFPSDSQATDLLTAITAGIGLIF